MWKRLQFRGSSYLYHLARGRPRVSHQDLCSSVSVRAWTTLKIKIKTARMPAIRAPLKIKAMDFCLLKRQAWKICLIQTSALRSQVHIIKPRFRFIMQLRIQDARIFSKCKIILREGCMSINCSNQRFSVEDQIPLTAPRAFMIYKIENQPNKVTKPKFSKVISIS